MMKWLITLLLVVLSIFTVSCSSQRKDSKIDSLKIENSFLAGYKLGVEHALDEIDGVDANSKPPFDRPMIVHDTPIDQAFYKGIISGGIMVREKMEVHFPMYYKQIDAKAKKSREQ